MKYLKIGAGTSFNISIPLTEDISAYDNILAAIYTDRNRPVKFSYVEKDGFNKLNVDETGLQLTGLLTGAQTSNMKGCLFMEMRFVKTVDGIKDEGNSISTPVLDNLGQQIELTDNVLEGVL